MRFYRIRQTGDKKITGLSKGGAQAKHDEDTYTDKAEWRKYVAFLLADTDFKERFTNRVFPSEIFNLEIELRKKSKVTDFLTFANALGSNGNFMISDRVVNILKTVNTPDYQLHNVKVNNLIDYHYKLFYFPALPLKYLDLEKSEFVTGSDLLMNKQYQKINSTEEYLRHKQETLLIRCERIVLNKTFPVELDIFSIAVSPSLFISEKLKDLFEMFQISGIAIQEPNDERIEITSC